MGTRQSSLFPETELLRKVKVLAERWKELTAQYGGVYGVAWREIQALADSGCAIEITEAYPRACPNCGGFICFDCGGCHSCENLNEDHKQASAMGTCMYCKTPHLKNKNPDGSELSGFSACVDWVIKQETT